MRSKNFSTYSFSNLYIIEAVLKIFYRSTGIVAGMVRYFRSPNMMIHMALN